MPVTRPRLTARIAALVPLAVACEDPVTLPDGDGELPDATFNMTVEGDDSLFDQFRLEGQQVTTHTIGGSYNNANGLLVVNAQELGGWSLSMVVTPPSFITGNYAVVGDGPEVMALSLPEAGSGYTAVDGVLIVSSLDLYAEAAGYKEWFITGTFRGDLVGNADDTQTVGLAGSFAGVNIKESD